MTYVMLPNLRIVLFFVSPIVKSFKKIFMSCFAMSCIIVYSTTIIPDALDKVASRIELWVVECWST